MDGAEDDELNLCCSLCSTNSPLYSAFSSLPRLAYDHLSRRLNYASRLHASSTRDGRQ